MYKNELFACCMWLYILIDSYDISHNWYILRRADGPHQILLLKN